MRGRHVASGVLALLACLAVLAVVPVVWLNAQLHGTAYADTVGPLAKDPSVQRAMADRVAETVAGGGEGLSPIVVDVVRQEIPAVMRTPGASRIWLAASLAARESLLTGNGGEVSVDIRELVRPLADRLGPAGSVLPSELPDEMTSIVLVDVPALAQVRTIARMAPTLAYVIPVLAAGLMTLALLTSLNRWRTLTVVGIVVAAGTLAEMLLIGPIQDSALAGVDDGISRAVLAAIAEAFADSLRSALIIPLVVAGVVAVVSLMSARLTSRRVDEVDRIR
ncbi:hypothetical protein ABN028_32340 [Actinopolymorpha sp. B17G11]|uniref:hypothetical protein n=1 Tax=Actinopolymorpha sp. B17G11 TaxID=3160861 RepID=UPI0032E4A89B